MTPARWRVVILVVCALAISNAIASVLSSLGFAGAPPWTGRLGASFHGFQLTDLKIENIAPGGAADIAGLRPGDRIDLRSNSLLERFWLQARVFNGRPVTLHVKTDSTEITRVIVPKPDITAKSAVVDFARIIEPSILATWFAFFAALIAWKRYQVRELQVLGLSLAFTALYVALDNWAWSAPWVWAYVFSGALKCLALPLAASLAIRLAGFFGQPLSRARQVAHLVGYAAAGVMCLQGVGTLIGLVTLWYAPFSSGLTSPTAEYVLLAAALSASALAIASARGTERQRSAWILAPLILALALNIGSDLVPMLLPLSYWGELAAASIVSLISLMAPIALTYAALSRRIIDIGFVLNRAAVYAAVSIVIVGMFTLVEWSLGGWLHSANKVTNVAVSAVLALALGLSIHAIHSRVDRIIDNAFFRKRHEDEQALRRFGREAAFITSAVTLIERATAVLDEHTGCSSAYFITHDSSGRLVGFDQDDPALVSLRASHEVIDLGVVQTQIEGEYAYPMVARGRLVGALVLGPKLSGESYAPDEGQAILELAHGVGVALDLLEAKDDATGGALADIARSLSKTASELEHSSRAIARAVGAFEETLRALRDSLEEKLREGAG